jgi:hypothetical protein
LKERGVRSSGLKAQLVDLAQQYCSDVFDPNPANTVSIEESFDEKRKIFDDGQLKWVSLEEQLPHVPNEYNLDSVNNC